MANQRENNPAVPPLLGQVQEFFSWMDANSIYDAGDQFIKNTLVSAMRDPALVMISSQHLPIMPIGGGTLMQ